MIKTVLLLVYLSQGQIIKEEIPMQNMADCEKRHVAIMAERVKRPMFESGIVAACVNTTQKEA